MLEVNNKMCFLEESFELESTGHSPHPCPADGLLDTSTQVLQIAGGFRRNRQKSLNNPS